MAESYSKEPPAAVIKPMHLPLQILIRCRCVCVPIFVNVRESGVMRVHEKVCSDAHNTAVNAATSTKSFPQLAQAEKFNFQNLFDGITT
jgi:hypothetical protein